MVERQEHPDRGLGAQGALGAVAVSFAPAWVGWHTLVDIVGGDVEAPSLPFALAVLAICVVLIVALLLLAYRMLTGSSRREDGGLVNPVLLLLFSLVVIAMGITVGYLTLRERAYIESIGGMVFIVFGAKGLQLSLGRLRGSHTVDS